MPPSCFIGAVRPEELLDSLLGDGSKPTSDPPALDLAAVPARKAAKMCEEFIRAVEKSHLCPNFRFFISSPISKPKTGQWWSSKDTAECDDILPTIGVRQQSFPPKPERQPKCTNFREQYNFATSLLAIDVLEDGAADPFVNPSDYMPTGTIGPPLPLSKSRPLQRPTTVAKNALRSITFRAQAHFLRQHRTHYWQILLIGSSARILRWDHAGAVVSQRFSYIVHPELIAAFLWRFAHVDDARRGFDTTVSLPTKKETGLFVSAVRKFLSDMDADTKDGAPVRKLIKAKCTLDEDTKTWPTWKMHVTNDETGSATDLIVRRAFTYHDDVFSRATRAYIAYDLGARRLVFAKDSWRTALWYPEPEFKTLQELLAHGVPHVPAALYGGDVREPPGADGVCGPEHATTSQDLLADKRYWSHPDVNFTKQVHHRIVQNIAYPIDENVSARDFVQALHDAVIALETAHSKMGFTHRDISSGNVMITSDGRGLLIDWENAGGDQDPTDWSGTWAFVSVHRGQDPRKIRDLPDDLESIFWLLVYNGLRLYSFGGQYELNVLNEAVRGPDGRKLCSPQKVRWLYDGLGSRRQHFHSPIFERLVRRANDAWGAAYEGEIALGKDHQGDAHVHDDVQRVRDPQFWIKMFQDALDEFDGSAKTKTPDWVPPAQRSPFPLPPRKMTVKQESPDIMALLAKAKRKANGAEDNLGHDGGYGTECPRRSKRVRTKANLG